MSKYRVSNKRKKLYRLTYSLYDFYETYKEKNKDISREKFLSIALDYFEMIAKKIAIERKIMRFPYNLTTLRIQKVRKTLTRKPRVDFQKTKQLGKIVYYNNMHSRGCYFRWYWERYPYFIKNKTMYEFRPSAVISKMLSNEIFRCNLDPLIKDYEALL